MGLLHRKFYKSVISINLYNPTQMNFYTVGSGFFVYYNEDIYLVTNKHVLNNLDDYYISLFNSTLKNRRFIHITHEKSHLFKRTYHPIPEVDVATVKLNPLLYKHLQIDSIPISEVGLGLKLMESYMVFEGSDVYLLGHPLNLTAANNMYPICRQGSIALISNIYGTKLNSKTFLIDCFAFPGNSGGPVFLKPELLRFNNEKSLNKTYLIGLVSTIIVSSDKQINTGLSVVISIDHVFECLTIMEDN